LWQSQAPQIHLHTPALAAPSHTTSSTNSSKSPTTRKI
jgi:hypothetical protein